MWTRADLKSMGKIAFKANYWKCVAAAVILTFAAGGFSSSSARSGRTQMNNVTDQVASMSSFEIMIAVAVAAFVITIALVVGFGLKIFIFNPLVVGGQRFFLINREVDGSAKVNEFGYAFKSNYKNIVKIMFMRDLYTFLWTLLFIVPGVIKSYQYRMIPYLLAENPDMTAEEAFATTTDLMTGNKMAAFLLDFSFIGWWILTALTAGILGIFYVAPWIYATDAELYWALKNGLIAE